MSTEQDSEVSSTLSMELDAPPMAPPMMDVGRPLEPRIKHPRTPQQAPDLLDDVFAALAWPVVVLGSIGGLIVLTMEKGWMSAFICLVVVALVAFAFAKRREED